MPVCNNRNALKYELNNDEIKKSDGLNGNNEGIFL